MADPQINIGINPVIAAASIRAVASDIQKGLSNVGIPIRVEPNIVAGRGGRNIDASTQRGTDVSILRKAAKKSKAEEALTRIFDAVAAQELKTLQSSQRLVDATEKLEGARAAAANGDRKAARQIGGYIAAVRNATLAHEENKERLNFLNETTAAAATSIGRSQAVLAGLAKQQLRLGGLQLDRNQLFAANIGVMPIRDERGVVVGERAQTDEEAERESARDAEIQKRINKQMQAEQQKSANFIREWNRTLREYNRAVSGAAAGVASAFDRDVAPRKKFLRGAVTTVLAGSEKALESGDVDAAKKLKQRADLLLSNEKNFGNEEAKARTELKNRLAAQAAKIKEAERLQAQNNEKVRRQIEFVNAKTSLDQVAVQLASAKNRGDVTAATATQKSANAIVENAREAGVNGRNLRVLNSILRNISKEANSLEGELRKQANAAKSTVSRQDAIDKIREAETLIAQNKIAEAAASLEASRVAAANAKDPEGKREADRRIVAAQRGVEAALNIQKQKILNQSKRERIAATATAAFSRLSGPLGGDDGGAREALKNGQIDLAKQLVIEAISIRNSIPQTTAGKRARASLTLEINSLREAIKKEEAAANIAANTRLRVAKIQQVVTARNDAISAIAAGNFDQARDLIRQVKFGARDLKGLGSSQASQDRLSIELDNLRMSYRDAVSKEKQRIRAVEKETIERRRLSDTVASINAKLQSELSSISKSFGVGGGGGGGGGRGGRGGASGGFGGGTNPFDDGGLSRFEKTISRINGELKIGNASMQSFAERTGLAAVRLAAWSTPAAFLFLTIGALRNAVTEIINLDKEIRRLTFFSIGSQSIDEFNSKIKQSEIIKGTLQKNFDSLINLSDKFGVSVKDVAKAANTVARIGQQTFDAGGDPSRFLEAVTALTKLEGGALSADTAAELLNATLAQFKLSSDDALLVAAKLGTVSLQTSFDVERLATVLTRFGSAALNVQNLNIDQSLAISAIAAKTFGTNASRLGTVLRQVTTKILQSREELEKLTGIDIATEGGQLKSFQTVIDVFKEVQRASGTIAVEPLTRLLGDTDQRSDIIAFASIIGEVEASFKKFGNAAIASENSAQQVLALFNATEFVAEDASTSINRLENAIIRLAKSSGATEIVKSLTTGLAGAINDLRTFIDAFIASGNAAKTFGAIATVVFSRLAKSAAGALVTPFINFNNFSKDIKKTSGLSFAGKDNENLINATVELEKNKLITQKEALALNLQNNKIQENIQKTSAKIVAQEEVVNKLKTSSVATRGQIARAESGLNNLIVQRNLLLKQEASIRNTILEKTNLANRAAGFAKRNAGNLIAVGGAAASFSGNEKVASAGFGAAIGAELGSAFGPKGAVIGGILGLIGGAAESIGDVLFSLGGQNDLEKQLKETARSKERDRQLRIANEARASTARQIESQRIAEERASKEIKDALRTREGLLSSISELENRIQQNRLIGLSTEGSQNALLEKNKALRLVSAKLSKAEADDAERRLRIESRLEDVSIFSEIRSAGIDSLRKIENTIGKIKRISEEEQINIDVKFDKLQLRSELEALAIQSAIRISALTDAQAKGNISDITTATRELSKVQTSTFKASVGLIKLQIDEREKLLTASENSAKRIFESYKAGADQLRSSAEESRKLLSDIFGLRLTSATQQNERARVGEGERFSILPQSFNEQISDVSKSLGLVANSIARIGVVGGIDARSNNFGQGQKGFQALNSDVQDVSKKFKELIQVQQQLITVDSTELRLKEDNLKREIQALTDKIEQDKKLLSDQEKAVQAILSERRIELQKQKELISILDARIKKEAEVGKLIINAPQEFVKNSTKLASSLRALFEGTIGGRRLGDRSRQLDTDRSGDLSRQEIEKNLPIVADILQERVRQLGKQFPSIVPEILKSLDFAAQAGIELIIPPELLSDIVARAPVTRPGQGGDIIRQREGAEAGANKALNAIEAENTRLINITGERIRLESALLGLEKNRKIVLEEQNNIFKNTKLPAAFDAITTKTKELEAEFEKLRTTAMLAEELSTQLKNGTTSIENFSDKIKELSEKTGIGDRALFDASDFNKRLQTTISSTNDVLTDYTEALGANATVIDSFGERTKEFKETINTLKDVIQNDKIEVDLNDLEVQLTHVIRHEFAGGFGIEEFKNNTVSELTKKLDEIRSTLQKLVQVEINRGTALNNIIGSGF